MGEGAIEGNAAMYELPGPLATEFPFSRFREARQVAMLSFPPSDATLDASSTDLVAGAANAPLAERRLAEEGDLCAPPSAPPPQILFQSECNCDFYSAEQCSNLLSGHGHGGME